MAEFSCDLHIHSTLSPCGSLDMSPKNIVSRAKEVGLDVIAITDHNMVENTFYAHEIGKELGVFVLFGMELQTQEEIHILAIFDTYDCAVVLQEMIYGLLPDVNNDPDYFGDQVVVNEGDEIVRFEGRLLLNSADISVGDAVSWIKLHDGLAIASHVDSPTFSIISQLGYVPEDLPFDALEIRDVKKVPDVLPLIMRRNMPFVTFSDAHYLQDIGKRRTILEFDRPKCKEMSLALQSLQQGVPS